MNGYRHQSKALDWCEPIRAQWIMLGVLSIFIGTLVAISLVPFDPTPPGVLRESGIALGLALLMGPLVAALKHSRFVFRAEALLLLAPIYWILSDLIQGYYPMVLIDRTEVIYALAAVGLFSSFCYLGFLGRPWRLPGFLRRAVRIDVPARSILILAWLAFLLAMLTYAIPSNFAIRDMIEALGNPRFTAPWVRGAYGGWSSFYDHLKYFGMILPALAVLYGRKKGRMLTPGVLVILALSIIFLLFIAQGGNRRYIGVAVGAGVLVYILSSVRLKMAQILTVGVVLFLLLSVMQLIYLYRGEGLENIFTKEEVRQVDYLHVDDNFLRLAQTIHYVPDTHPHVYHRWVIYVAGLPIPRALWPDKPTSRGIFELNELVGIAGVGLSSSVIGEFYLSLGFLAIALGGWFYGRLAVTANTLLLVSETPDRFLFYGAASMALFAGVRSLIDLVLMSYVLLAAVGLSIIYRSLFSSKRTPHELKN